MIAIRVLNVSQSMINKHSVILSALSILAIGQVWLIVASWNAAPTPLPPSQHVSQVAVGDTLSLFEASLDSLGENSWVLALSLSESCHWSEDAVDRWAPLLESQRLPDRLEVIVVRPEFDEGLPLSARVPFDFPTYYGGTGRSEGVLSNLSAITPRFFLISPDAIVLTVGGTPDLGQLLADWVQ